MANPQFEPEATQRKAAALFSASKALSEELNWPEMRRALRAAGHSAEDIERLSHKWLEWETAIAAFEGRAS